MENLNELKQLWQTADTGGLPKPDEMMQMVKKFRSQKVNRKLRVIFISILLVGLMVAVMFFYKSALITTRIGEVLMIMACCVLIFTNTRSLKRFYILNDCSNNEFVTFLEQTRLNQEFFYTKTQVAALLLSSAGLLFYLYEFVCKDINMLIITYAIALLYILLLWFVIRPRVYDKEVQKLNATMERIKSMSNQIR
jgi:hypothetical protein